ncbi:family 20 glycosylhydrolase [Microbacterium sp. SD291]|uniref:family 20 glycosylhydrolase n=1 Tax=Microbacterium sp. SD291 TaxID=2782007 RepID=UPI001A96524E|nr:family 20 glycosylhydrolase [Microbacterium sp. SD291]MBO0982087.1 family 20 glycosylhydrolase [Microbacterium sp. SD291]
MTEQHAGTAAGERWLALPQPSLFAPAGGRWRPKSVRVIAYDGRLVREAVRLEGELRALGIAGGGRAVVRLRLEDRAAESFSIEVDDDIEVRAGDAAGAFRATRQLLHNLRAQDSVPRGRVHSSPAVRERGFHLDAARKHFPAARIVELLHSLADVGVNSFQWHVSENEGFRIGSESFPEIVSPEHVTRDQALAIADAAAELHIDLIPSLDMPGHLRHALSAHPELRLPSSRGLDTDHALDITRDEAVAFAHGLIDDLAPLFPHSTSWHLGGDEFVDFARVDDHPLLAETAGERFGAQATGFDLLTDFVNRTAAHLREGGFATRAWNDGMLRGAVVPLDRRVALAWWTNWHAQMRPLSAAVDAGHELVNFNDGLFYHVLGELSGYKYPDSSRIWGAEWHPGLFSALPGGLRQELAAPYPEVLRGAAFAVWADDPEAQSVDEVFAATRRPVRAMAERAWNAGSRLTHDEFCAIDTRIGVSTRPTASAG